MIYTPGDPDSSSPRSVGALKKAEREMEERENRWVEILKLENLLKENPLLNERLFLLESEKMEMGKVP